MDIKKTAAALCLMAAFALPISAEGLKDEEFYVGFYIKNNGGLWQLYEGEGDRSGRKLSSSLGSFDLDWALSAGDMTLYAPAEDWESVPDIGVRIGSYAVDEVGDSGYVACRVSDIKIVSDRGVTELGGFDIEGELSFTEDLRAANGYAAHALTEEIKAALGLDDAAYMQWLPTVTELSCRVEVTRAEYGGFTASAAAPYVGGEFELSAAESSSESPESSDISAAGESFSVADVTAADVMSTAASAEVSAAPVENSPTGAGVRLWPFALGAALLVCKRPKNSAEKEK